MKCIYKVWDLNEGGNKYRSRLIATKAGIVLSAWAAHNQ